MKKKFIDEELYQRVSRGELILFAIYLVLEREKKCTFEELMGECFLLFPKTFSFSKFPKWPDSRKLDRALRSLRAKKLIVGDPQTFFSLTKFGKKTAEDISKIFRQRKLI